MKNKYYNIFFTSEKDGFGKSIRVSNFFLFGIVFFNVILNKQIKKDF